MIGRRDFIKNSILAASTAMRTPLDKNVIGDVPLEKKKNGESRQEPDTLDLADRGELAINGILGSLDPEIDYECCFMTYFDVHPAYMVHWSTMVSGVMPKYVESLPMLRQMSGSDANIQLENGFINAMLENASDDGLVYDRASTNRPWNVGVYYGAADKNEDYANMAGNGRLLAGFTYWYQATNDDIWKKRANKTAERMLELAIVEDDFAWYPNPGVGNDFSYPRISGWTTRKPPSKANEGFEGATLFYLFQPLRGFTRWYLLTGDERFKTLAGKFVNFGVQNKFWGTPEDANPQAGAQRGHFKGHVHGTLAALRGLLDYAIVANNHALKQFVRDGYECVRQKGIHRLGAFPHVGDSTEGCVLGDMIGMAVSLTDAGLGDYWDDVEMYARNGLVCAQAVDLEEMSRVSQNGKHRPPQAPWGAFADNRFTGNNKGVLPGQEIHDNVLERSVGAFGYLSDVTHLEPRLMHCCTANGSQGIYYAWEGIIRLQGGTAQINMWLNRRSQLVDVFSFLPYEGKLWLQNKGAKKIFIRKPGWAKHTRLRVKVNGHDSQPVWIGNRMMFDDLKGNEKIVIETTVSVETCEYILLNINAMKDSHSRFRCEFKGHTAINVQRIGEVPESQRNWYKLFRRQLSGDIAPMKDPGDYLPPRKLIQWSVI